MVPTSASMAHPMTSPLRFPAHRPKAGSAPNRCSQLLCLSRPGTHQGPTLSPHECLSTPSVSYLPMASRVPNAVSHTPMQISPKRSTFLSKWTSKYHLPAVSSTPDGASVAHANSRPLSTFQLNPTSGACALALLGTGTRFTLTARPLLIGLTSPALVADSRKTAACFSWM